MLNRLLLFFCINIVLDILLI